MLRIRTDYPRHSNIVMRMHVAENVFTLNGRNFLLSDIKSRNDFRSFCRFVFPFSTLKGSFHDPTFAERIVSNNVEYHFDKPAPLAVPFERYSQTYNSKFSEFPDIPVLNCPLSIIFYPETQNFKDALLIVTRQDDIVPLEITIDDNGQKVPYVPEYEGPLPVNEHLLPKCTLIAENATVSYNGTTLIFTYNDIFGVPKLVDFTATVKTDKGYVSHNKFDVVSGVGKFKFIPLGLSSGEKVKIQVGIGKYTDICNTELTVE